MRNPATLVFCLAIAASVCGGPGTKESYLKRCGTWSGVIDASAGTAKVELWYAWEPSTLPGSRTLLQNRIDVEQQGRRYRFEWPTDEDFGGKRCEIIDLDADGTPEVLFVQAEAIARVVSFEQGRFIFRVDSDQLTSDQVRGTNLSMDSATGFRGESSVALKFLSPAIHCSVGLAPVVTCRYLSSPVVTRRHQS
jgi:hypothetical protein